MEVRSLQSSVALTRYQQNTGQSITQPLAASAGKALSSPAPSFALPPVTNPATLTSVNRVDNLAATQAVIGADKVSQSNTVQTNTARTVSESQGVTAVAGNQSAGESGPTVQGSEAHYKDEELAHIRDLAQRDREVRSHEAAHAAAGGAHAGAPNYTYTRGPDGKLYATEGAVSIDTSAVPNDPEATIAKAESIIRAALAPANPSPQDLKVAAEAQALLVNAQAELSSNAAKESEQARFAEALTVKLQADDEDAEADKETSNSPEPFEKDKLSANADTVAERLDRAREQQQEFASQLQELNRKVGKVLEQLINTGATAGVEPQGTFIDIRA